MSGCRKYVDETLSQIHVGNSLWPLREPEESFHRDPICRYHLDPWNVLELQVTGSMIKMLMGVHHKQRQSLGPRFGKQLQNRIGEGHLTRATESPGVDQIGPG